MKVIVSIVSLCLVVLLSASSWAGLGKIERGASMADNKESHALDIRRDMSSYRYSGSLWNEQTSHSVLFTDAKARNVNDILTVNVVETSDASKQSSTKTSRKSSVLGKITEFFGSPLDFGLENFWGKNNAFKPEVAATADNSYDGSGKTSGSGKLVASLSARVVDVMSNGNLVIEGQKEVAINNERQFIFLSGVVRPEDILPDNVVLSTFIADARIEYRGAGVISDKQRPGFGHRAFDWLWPF
jgi:flagellar L-ring protein precursor FlgH